jgi:hypothetical protein
VADVEDVFCEEIGQLVFVEAADMGDVVFGNVGEVFLNE